MTLADQRWLVAQAVAKLPAGRVLFMDAPEIAAAVARERPDVSPAIFSSSRESWLAQGQATFSGVCMGFHPAKDLVRMQLAMLAEQLPAGTRLWLFGAGRAGIASAPQLLGDNWEHIEKVAYGGHAQLWHAVLAENAPRRGLAAWEKRSVVTLAGQELVLISLPGVFSHGEVDEGTRLLLEHLPLLKKGSRVHDFGCGCGVIAAWLKLRQPDLVVSGSDISAMAHAASKATLKANGITGVNLHVEPGLAPIPGVFDVIVSNPPFHTGQQTDYSISAGLFAESARKLRGGGSLYVVGNRFLPYQKQMAEIFGAADILAQTPQFWVLHAHRS